MNDKKIDFCYQYKFIKEGKYKLKIIFKKLLKNTSWMFGDCSSLTSLDLSNFNTNNVKDMMGMFYYCTSLTSLDLSYFNTQNVNDMNYMFYHCTSLTSLDLSNFNIQNVNYMYDVFSYCNSLSYIDISNFIVENTIYIFSGLPENCSVKINIESNNKINTIPNSCEIELIHS